MVFSRTYRSLLCLSVIILGGGTFFLEAVYWSTRSIPATTPLRTRYATPGFTNATLFVTHGSNEGAYNSCKDVSCSAPLPPIPYSCFVPTAFTRLTPELQPIIEEMQERPCQSLHPTTFFSFNRAEFFVAHNFNEHWFAEASLPVQKLKEQTIWYSSACTPPQDPFAQTVIAHLPELLAAFNLQGKYGRQDVRGFCDSSVVVGYTRNCVHVGPFDFLDFTVRAGLWIPTGKRMPLAWPDDQFFGFEGRWGLPLNACASLGIFQWLLFHGHVGIMPLVGRCHIMRTSIGDATGCALMRPLCTSVEEHGGTLITTGVGLTADHFFQGFSLDIDYRLDYQNRRSHRFLDERGYPREQDCAPYLLSWTRHTIGAGLSYDFSCQLSPQAPIIGIYGSSTVGGRRVYKTSLSSLFIGVQCLFCY